jgi:hypothetical protein
VPHSPERYIQAIETCEKAGMEVIILDSVSHEWEYLIDAHACMTGNSFTNWGKITPRHNAFIQQILQSSCHIISTIRTKQDYTLVERNGRMIPEKVGLKSIQCDGTDYEFTLVFDLDIKNNATASKDRTGLFYVKPEQKLSSDSGRLIKDWCETGSSITVEDVSERIGACHTMEQLLSLYKMFPQYQQVLSNEFKQRKRELIITSSSSNGVSTKHH